ncbi:FecR family protein [Marinilabilia rubra]|uniref:Iron dicitrate transport regulator FecR n=1 Tax=Marinilabilia rubra TaxID=2162893 RepID=A0A2U2B6W6_9BACT|nr:FecR family protein [Marinilabilia rubra]PWD98821.1 iron dicitrate transport regulator FecR [Marinilabilia rubra]
MGRLTSINSEELIRYFSGECSSEEKERIDLWRKSSATNESFFEDFRKIWDAKYQSLLPEDVLKEDWSRIRKRIQFQSPVKRRIGIWNAISRVAAVFILLLTVSGALYTYWNVPGFGRWTAFQTGDYVDSLQLPDNSMVFLNNHSSLKYLKSFGAGRRAVSLDGEGYFDVTRDTDNPFMVNTPEGVDVKVLGTSFHLKSGKGIENLELNVTEGVVGLSYREFSDKVESGNSAVINGSELQVLPTTNTNFLSWKTRKLVFSQSSLKSIVDALKEYYTSVDKIDGSTQSDILITTTFNNQPISDVLDELEFHFDKKFTLKEGVLIISD